MRSHRHWIMGLVLLVPLAVAACADNPTELHDEQLTVELTLSSSHIHILSPVTFTATVRDEHGNIVTDMDTLRVERKAVGSDTWRTASDLELVGGTFTGEYTFMSSGEYEVRMMGMRAGHSTLEQMTLTEDPGHLEAVPAHGEAGGYRIEYESFPGHIHEGDEVEFKFWIMEPDPDPVTNERAPIAGVSAEIHCLDGDGSTESHTATEVADGEYTAKHTFAGAGDASAEIHFTGADGNEASVKFDFAVAHGH